MFCNHGLDFEEMSLSLIHISEPTRLLSISYAVFCLAVLASCSRSSLIFCFFAATVLSRLRS